METSPIICLINDIRDKANQFIITELKKRGIRDIVPSHSDILVNLYIHGPMSMGKLAERINRKKNTLTVLVYKLVKWGYIAKRDAPNDQRVTIISLTEKALSLKAEFEKISSDLIAKTLRGISDKEKEFLQEVLQQIFQNLE